MTSPRVPTSDPRLPTLDPACARVREDAALLALGMLDADEAARVHDHLLLCPACDEAVSRLAAVTALIGLAADQVEPPASAKTALLARVAQDAYDRQATSSTTAPRSSLSDSPTFRLPDSRLPTPSPRRWPAALAASRWFAPAALVVALALGSFAVQGALSSQDKVSSLERTLARSERSNDSILAHALRVSLDLGRQRFGDDAVAYALLRAGAADPAAADPEAAGLLLGDPSEPRASLAVWNLAGSPGAYTVTLEAPDGSRADAGALTVDDRGVGSLDLTIFQPIGAYAVVHIAPTASPETDVFTLRLDPSATLTDPPEE